MPNTPHRSPQAEELFQQAVNCHRHGDLGAAVQLYVKILKLYPEDVQAHANLASIHTRQNRYTEALRHYKEVLVHANVKTPPEVWFNYANLQQRLNLRTEAQSSLRKAIELQPGFFQARCNLANLLRDEGALEEAIEEYRAALRLSPDTAILHRNLGATYLALGKVDEAIEHLQSASRLDPDMPAIQQKLAEALQAKGFPLPSAIGSGVTTHWVNPDLVESCWKWAEQNNASHVENPDDATIVFDALPRAAVLKAARTARQRLPSEQLLALLQRALERWPDDPELLQICGETYYGEGQMVNALKIYLHLATVSPGKAYTHNALGVVHQALGKHLGAENHWKRCLQIDPTHVEALSNLGTFYRLQKKYELAYSHLEASLKLRPDDEGSIASIAYTLLDQGRISEALAYLNPTDRKLPEHFDLLSARAYAAVQQARIDDAQALWRRARGAPNPNTRLVIANTLFSSLYSDQMDVEALTLLHRDMGREIEQEAPLQPLPIIRASTHRPIRVGYLSPDLRSHPIGMFIEPVLQRHRTDLFHITGYALPCVTDDTTIRLKGYASTWRDLTGYDCRQMVEQIRDDGIDILVDLAGHTAGGRTDVVAQRAAPIQASFLGYPFTSGMKAVDYLIADAHAIPEDESRFYTEQIVRLPHSFLCYQPRLGTPEVAPLPAVTNPHITFGSYNHLPKVSDRCIALWAAVLHAVPGSILRLLAQGLADPGTRALFASRFAQHGIHEDRLQLLPPVTPVTRFLAEYGKLDIALDTLPYNGGTTSCDALWMGVPVISLPGKGFCRRMGAGILHAVGHPEWIARDEMHYIELATQLSSDREALAGLRNGLRGQMRKSSLCDATGYVTALEAALSRMMEERGKRC